MELRKITDSKVVDSINGSENAFMQKEDDIVKVPISLLMDAATKLPIARAGSADGIAYTATDAGSGSVLPEVSVANNNEHISAIGKGRQIVFIPDSTNKSNAPTLQLNGGEVIQIRLRAPKNQGTYNQSPDATFPVPVGALMCGVPYTLTFCGKYWLVDSQIAQFDEYQADLMRTITDKAMSLYEGDTIGVPIINSTDDIDDNVSIACIVRSEAENKSPPTDGSVKLPTESRVEEILHDKIGEAVRYTEQDLTDSQKEQARTNIGAQEVISDLDKIRSGAELGSNSVQENDVNEVDIVKASDAISNIENDDDVITPAGVDEIAKTKRFVITLSGSGTTSSPYVLDKTYEEIVDAYNKNAHIWLLQGGVLRQLIKYSSNSSGVTLLFQYIISKTAITFETGSGEFTIAQSTANFLLGQAVTINNTECTTWTQLLTALNGLTF